MENIKPNNFGNADFISETCYPMVKLAMLRYEAIFDHYSEEPQSIHIKLAKDGEKFGFEHILRIRRWISNKKAYSWCIYSQEREWNINKNVSKEVDTLGQLIIRYVEWDMEQDIHKIKKNSNDCREGQIEYWPSVHTKNIFLNSEDSQLLIKKILNFDKTIENGILLMPKLNPKWKWRDLEIKRLFNWGQVHAIWSPTRENYKMESCIAKMEEDLKEYSANEYANIYSMELNFSVDPVIYKNIITGTKSM